MLETLSCYVSQELHSSYYYFLSARDLFPVDICVTDFLYYYSFFVFAVHSSAHTAL